jgi:hypothetical protein
VHTLNCNEDWKVARPAELAGREYGIKYSAQQSVDTLPGYDVKIVIVRIVSRMWKFHGRMFCLALALIAGVSSAAAGVDLSKLPPPVSRHIDFAKDIVPLLADKCWSCHSANQRKSGLNLESRPTALKGGENYSPTIKPGESAQSPLIHLVAGLVPDMLMPRKGDPLTAQQIGIFRAWIDQGAVWPKGTTLTKASVHWSLKPVVRPAEPKIKHAQLKIRNPIDSFVLAKLAEHKLSPSPEADRRVLIRRLYFDLIGMPPSPPEVDAFLADRDKDAYEKVARRLLASPRYGECWARHWLDVVRFAETYGFEENNPRPNAWRYRDYVIRAFNEDVPYDRFVSEQLAGDTMDADEATGFLVGGASDLVKSPDPVLTANQRSDELHDIVSTTGSAFLGLTVGCARCHDHKFDPIPQKDYYALKAVFAGVHHGDRKLGGPEEKAREQEVKVLQQKLAQLNDALDPFEPLAQIGSVDTNRLRVPVNARLNIERFAPVAARRLRFTIKKTTGAEPCIDELEVFSAALPSLNVALASTGTKATASSVYPNSELHRIEHLNDGQYGNPHSWISNESGQGWVELDFPETVTINKVMWGRDREQKYTDRLAVDYRIEVCVETNHWKMVASSDDRQPYGAETNAIEAISLASVATADRDRVRKMLAQRAQHEARLKELADVPMAYAGQFDAQPEPTHRLNRGDPTQPLEVVAPGAFSAISLKVGYDTTAVSTTDMVAQNAPSTAASASNSANSLTPDQERRVALANWIVEPSNPLTARVLVNRLWLYHFGEGLVSTPSDFGVNGTTPTHPELLDWLAAELLNPKCGPAAAYPWSIKHLQYLIVTSAAYRQSSESREDESVLDAGSRYLWRFPPRRLTAEAIRDATLAISGKLDLRMGGPGFSFFEPNENYVRVYNPKQKFGPEDWRRMIYGTIVRQRPDGVFGAFDCPDAGQITPKRTRSTTPLQALNLANSKFMMQQADFFAQRLEREAGHDVEAQVRRAFSLAFQRQADPDEVAASVKFVREQGLPIFCRELFNCNEFVYLF